MLDWFRSWHGAPTDPKWLVIGKRADAPPYAVSAFVWALLDFASQADSRGDVSAFDFETYAAVSGMDEEKARIIYAALEAKGVVVAGRIAQWERRQPKREDSNSSDRVKKHRGKDAAPELPLSSGAETVAPQAQSEPAPEPQAPASPAESTGATITPQAISIADEIAIASGHDLEFVPPSWCGAAGRVQMWLNKGWPPPIILENAKAQMHRKRDGPPASISYFERGIATAIARGQEPLPTVVPITEARQARHGKPQSPITAAADRLIAELDVGGGASGEGASRLLPQR